MWKIVNSPIVITIIVIASLFALKASIKPMLATEIRGMYKEISSIIEDSASDAKKSKAIQKFVQEIATQTSAGFAAGFKASVENGNTDAAFLETKKLVKVENIKYTEPKWGSGENIIYVIKNTSNKYIGSIKLNFEYYKNDELIDCENKWISEIQILEPNQEIALSNHRQLPQKENKEEQEQYKSDETKIIITGFDIKEIN